jgi:succinate-acetate transporter protein
MNQIRRKSMSLEVKKLANPGPLGLLGFGMTTILLNLHNADLIPLSIVIIAMGFALGGLAQIIAGIFEMKQGNTFAGTAFLAYGTFWWSLVAIWTMAPEGLEADKISMGYYLAVWGLFTAFMFIGTLKHNRITQIVFGSLTVLFFLLALGDFTGNGTITIIAGIVGLFCGFSAFYSAVGQIVNQEFNKNIFPL